MKNFFLATAAIFALTTSASAVELNFAGDIEYDIETEQTAIEFGPALSMAGFLLEPKVHATADIANTSVDLSGFSTKATYGLTPNVSLYGTIAVDKDFGYDTMTVGTSFNF